MATIPTPVSVKPVRSIVANNTSGSQPGAVSTTGTITTTVAVQTTTLMADAVIKELHEDEMVITEHPVEQGATISDHAYKLPSKLGLIYAWAAGSPQNTTQDVSFLKNLYKQFLNIQAAQTLCTVNTGKRIYQNMLIKALRMTEDKETENSLIIDIDFQEILMATTQTIPLSSSANQALPNKTGQTVNQGNLSLQPATNFNAGALP